MARDLRGEGAQGPGRGARRRGRLARGARARAGSVSRTGPDEAGTLLARVEVAREASRGRLLARVEVAGTLLARGEASWRRYAVASASTQDAFAKEVTGAEAAVVALPKVKTSPIRLTRPAAMPPRPLPSAAFSAAARSMASAISLSSSRAASRAAFTPLTRPREVSAWLGLGLGLGIG